MTTNLKALENNDSRKQSFFPMSWNGCPKRIRRSILSSRNTNKERPT